VSNDVRVHARGRREEKVIEIGPSASEGEEGKDQDDAMKPGPSAAAPKSGRSCLKGRKSVHATVKKKVPAPASQICFVSLWGDGSASTDSKGVCPFF